MDNLDPAHKLAIVSHMNEDHSDACLLYARHFAKNRQAKSAEMIDVSFYQITLRVNGELITVDFPRVAKTRKTSDQCSWRWSNWLRETNNNLLTILICIFLF